jgi:hypothetical protein
MKLTSFTEDERRSNGAVVGNDVVDLGRSRIVFSEPGISGMIGC